MRTICFLVVSMLLLTGCSGTVGSVAMMDSEELKTVNDLGICQTYGSPFANTAKFKAEIDRRHLLTDDEWRLVDAHQIRIGMSICGLLASWGSPGMYGAINRTVIGNSENIQWVYRRGEYDPARYVYTENGHITAFQD